MITANAKPQGSGTLSFNNEVYESQQRQREEVDAWLDILIESRFNPTLAELVKEIKTVYELSREPKQKETQLTGSWAGIVLDG